MSGVGMFRGRLKVLGLVEGGGGGGATSRGYTCLSRHFS